MASPRPPTPLNPGRGSRVAARIEATRLGLDIRYVVTNITSGTAEWLYADLYCARGQAENLIKLHKAQLASDRTSCRAASANQMRLILHTAAYWLVLAVRDAIPKAHALAKAEFTTIRLRLLKVAARVTETASRVRIAFASPAPTPSSSATWRGRSGRPRPEPRGVKPLPTRSLPPTRSTRSAYAAVKNTLRTTATAFCQRLSAEHSRTLMNKGG